MSLQERVHVRPVPVDVGPSAGVPDAGGAGGAGSAGPDGDAGRADVATGLADRIAAAVARTSGAVADAWHSLAASAAGGDPEPRELIGLLAAQGGGKQLRARLAAAAYLGMGGDDPAAAVGARRGDRG